MKHRAQTLCLRALIAVLAPGAWCFWTFAAWRSHLHTKLDNLKSDES